MSKYTDGFSTFIDPESAMLERERREKKCPCGKNERCVWPKKGCPKDIVHTGDRYKDLPRPTRGKK